MSNSVINCDIRLKQIVEHLSSNRAEVEYTTNREAHILINDSHYIISILSAPIVSVLKRISVVGATPKSVQESVKAVNDLSICVKAKYDIVSSTVTLSSAIFAETASSLLSIIYLYLSSIENAEAVMTGMIRQVNNSIA